LTRQNTRLEPHRIIQFLTSLGGRDEQMLRAIGMEADDALGSRPSAPLSFTARS